MMPRQGKQSRQSSYRLSMPPPRQSIVPASAAPAALKEPAAETAPDDLMGLHAKLLKRGHLERRVTRAAAKRADN
jgi:hypothetical protein